ncbi:unnamed protein product, partial [Polarella glacialis]
MSLGVSPGLRWRQPRSTSSSDTSPGLETANVPIHVSSHSNSSLGVSRQVSVRTRELASRSTNALKRQARRPRKIYLRIVAVACFTASNVALPCLLLLQMAALNIVIIEFHGWRAFDWLWIFVLIELALLLNLAIQGGPREVARSGSLQWIVYCWVFSMKSGIIFFTVLP